MRKLEGPYISKSGRSYFFESLSGKTVCAKTGKYISVLEESNDLPIDRMKRALAGLHVKAKKVDTVVKQGEQITKAWVNLQDHEISDVDDSIRRAFPGCRVGVSAKGIIVRGKPHVSEAEDAQHNPVDTVTLDIPLLIRMLEFAREDAGDDMVLHSVVDRMIEMSKTGETLSMDHYKNIIGNSK